MPDARNQFIAAVSANIPLCREHFRLVLRLRKFPATFPGHFIQIGCRDMQQNYSPEREFDWRPGRQLNIEGKELLSPLAMLRRPFSLAGRRDLSDAVELDIIHRIVGVGTDWLSKLTPGAKVDILGPLGNSFTLPNIVARSGRAQGPAAASNPSTAILIGGGVGIPPMLYLAAALDGQRAIAFSGALTRDLLPLTITADAANPDDTTPRLNIAEFASHNIPSVITTDDGSYGFRGYVTQALEKFLDETKFDTQPTFYTCGPEPMLKRVAEIAKNRGIECQIAIERAMACGMGTCQSCCIRVLKPDSALPPLPGKTWCYRLACTDGPIFKATDLLW